MNGKEIIAGFQLVRKGQSLCQSVNDCSHFHAFNSSEMWSKIQPNNFTDVLKSSVAQVCD